MPSPDSSRVPNPKKRSPSVLEDRNIRLRKASDWLRKKDPITKKLIDSIGPCKLKTIGNPYQVLIKSVLGQQLSVKVALTFERRLISLAGVKKFPLRIRL